MRYIYPFILLLIVGCSTTKYIPINSTEKTIYRDSLIYIKDTIEVAVPYEVIKETSLPTDTSYLKTSLAESIAYIDTTNNKLFHTLTQNGKLKAKVDTVFRVEYVDKIIEREIPIEVEVIKYKYDTLFWVLLGWAIFSVVSIFLKIFLIK